MQLSSRFTVRSRQFAGKLGFENGFSFDQTRLRPGLPTHGLHISDGAFEMVP